MDHFIYDLLPERQEEKREEEEEELRDIKRRLARTQSQNTEHSAAIVKLRLEITNLQKRLVKREGMIAEEVEQPTVIVVEGRWKRL
jgi:chromosome segregation ATPase